MFFFNNCNSCHKPCMKCTVQREHECERHDCNCCDRRPCCERPKCQCQNMRPCCCMRTMCKCGCHNNGGWDNSNGGWGGDNHGSCGCGNNYGND